VTATPDDEPRWEVVPNFRERTGIPAYRAPAADSPDPTVVEGHKQPSIARAPAILMSVCWSGFLFSVLGRTLLAGVISLAAVAVTIGATFVLTARRRAWKVPRLVASSEGLRVTDVTGRTTAVTWTGLGSPSLRTKKEGRDKAQLLEWTNASGARFSLNLGDTMDIVEARRAILAHAPLNLERVEDARHAYDPDRAS
jgi:hypothetical protein